jgi:GT2 family glycosyltransferase
VRHSIVISSYNRPESLSRCLEAASRQKGIGEVEIVVVDDGSDGDFKAIERNWKPKLNLKYVKIRHAGRASARNRGVRSAAGERIIFLDDDIMVRPGWLERHRAVDDPLAAVLGPYPLQQDKKHPRVSKAFLKVTDPVRFDLIKDPQNAGFPFFVTGNLSIDRAVFMRVGGFDERFKHYGWEDIDLGYRFERAGGRLIFDAQAKAVHAHRAMTRRDLWSREFQIGITAYQFWSKWRNEDLQFMKFWGDAPSPGPLWRRRLGSVAIEVLEHAAPNASLLDRLYERMIYSWRHAGAAEGMRLYGDSMREELPPPGEPAEARP